MNERPILYGFRAGPITIRYSVDIALLGQTNKNEVLRESDKGAKPLNSKSFKITG